MIDCFAAKSAFWIDPQGYVRPCCRYKGRMNHISEFNSFGDITNSKNYIEIREELSTDKFPAGCIRCENDEKNNLRSRRQFYNRIKMKSPDDFMVDISMGNFCNLKCRMCGPQNSTLWNSDYNYLNKIGLIEESKISYADAGFNAYQLSNEDIDKLIEHLESVKGKIYLELKGGEPLIMPQTELLINRLMELPNSKNITLLLITNGTVFPDWLYSISKKFCKLLLTVSIDGLGEVYNYIRGTSKFSFDDCFLNIQKFKSINNIQLSFNVVVQNLNIHQIIDIHLALIKYSNTISYITLELPNYLALNVMPKLAREKIYQNFLENSTVFGKYENQMKNIYKLLLIEPNTKDVERFQNITTALDKRRKQNLSSILPHLIDNSSL